MVPVCWSAVRKGAARVCARTLGELAGRKAALSFLMTSPKEGRKATAATVSSNQATTTAQRNRMQHRPMPENRAVARVGFPGPPGPAVPPVAGAWSTAQAGTVASSAIPAAKGTSAAKPSIASPGPRRPSRGGRRPAAIRR